jgi:glycosyltransferase involved in cell wall biosynthesis
MVKKNVFLRREEHLEPIPLFLNMRIAVNTRFPGVNGRKEYENFLHKAFGRITEKYSLHEFIFIHEKKKARLFTPGPRVKNIVAGPPGNHPLLWKYWNEVKIPLLLRRHHADVMVTCNGCCSLSAPVPQCLLVQDLSFLHHPAVFTKSELAYFKKNTPRSLQKAVSVVSSSSSLRNEISALYQTDPGKIEVVYGGVNNLFQPVADNVKSAIKEKFTAGKEYFIAMGVMDQRENWIRLLKAFSVFKKRQQTGMKLVITGELPPQKETFFKSLATYKYRHDVVIINHQEEQELKELSASAYGYINPAEQEGFALPEAAAMQCGVPVITTAGTCAREIYSDAALYADTSSPDLLAGKMMLLYKDETLRKNLIEKGRALVKQFSWDKTADLLWRCIEKAATG